MALGVAGIQCQVVILEYLLYRINAAVRRQHTFSCRIFFFGILFDTLDQPLHQNCSAIFKSGLADCVRQSRFCRDDNGVLFVAYNGNIKLILTDYQLTGRICRKRGDIFNIKAIPEVGTMAFDLAPTKE